MDIEKKLLQEHSKALTLSIVKYVGDDKSRFKILMDLFFKGEYPLSQRAAWPMSYIVINHPELIKPYFKQCIQKLTETNIHPAISRNILRMFQEIDIPEAYQGQLVDICFAFIRNETCAVAIRAFAITTAGNICKGYPELKNELLLLVNELKQHPQTPAIRVRIKSVLKELNSV